MSFPSPGLPIYIQSNEDTSLYWTANEGNFIYLMSPTTSNTQVWMIIKGNDNTYSIVSQKEGRSYAVTYVPIETCFTIEPYIEDKMEQKFRIESQNGSSPVAISIKEQTLYAIADQEKGFAEGSRIVTGAVNKKQWNLAPYISQIFYGTLIHSLSLTELKIISNALLGVDNCGKIAFLEPNVSNEQTLCDIIKRWGSTKDKIVRLSKRQFLLPGFVDTHMHAPQYPNAGIGMDLPLLDWLNKYTYPLEKKFLSIEFTKKIYPIVVNQLLRCGTTTAIYYATIHLESSKYLADLVHQKGQRGFIGKVNMDRNNPHGYFETMESSVRYTVQFVKYIQSLESSLITPIITPRSALCCTSDLMKSLGDIAKDYQIPIQSHLSENLAEIDEVKRSYPHLPDYTTVYDHYNVLQNNRTIMAHCIYLSSQERKLIKERNVGISHCPNSNFTLSSGVCNVRQLLDEGIKVGLGTDISGGFSKSILDSIRSASIASRVIYFSSMKSDKVYNPLTISELTYLATMGGAQLVNLENVIGNFEIGKEFDALLIDPEAEGSPIQIFDDIDTNFEKIFEKFLFLGDDRNIKAVYVKGRKVSGTDITNLEA